MKPFLPVLVLLLSGCAFVDGIKNEKNVTPIPPSVQTPKPVKSTASDTSLINNANVNAAKAISPVTR